MCRAYKSAQASQFDLLFLYGFVSSHAAHGFFPLRVEWATPSAALAEQAAALFRRAVRPSSTTATLCSEDLGLAWVSGEVWNRRRSWWSEAGRALR